MSRTTRWTIGWVVAACLCAALTVRAQDGLAPAKELYGSASYQDSLAMLERLKGGRPAPDEAFEIDKYRAFCLLALGRSSDAEQVIVEMLRARPRFRLDEAEASPRVVTAFRDIRRAQIPALTEQAYARGREAYEQKKPDVAAESFRLALDLASDPDAPTDRPLVKDIQTLATGFLTLVEAAAKAAEPKEPPVKPASQPPPAPPKRFYTAEDKDVTAPVIVTQDMPPWPTGVRVVEAKGVLEIVIDEKGSVEAALMRARVHPIFDGILVERAKTWRYRPATREGKPVKYLKRIEVAVQPPPGSHRPDGVVSWTR